MYQFKNAKLDTKIPDDLMWQAITLSVGKRGLADIFIFKDVRRQLKNYLMTEVRRKLNEFVHRGLIDTNTDDSWELPTWP
jgi:hypothetical protein